jgi:hypothetical protein
MGRRSGAKGVIFVALGLGLIISLILPEKFVIVLLATALVICGTALCRA